MPVLKNVRRELFAQAIAKSPGTGQSATQCYLSAGYRSEGHGAEVAASRLLSQVEVQQRIAEITAPAVRKTRVTVDSLACQFDAVFDAALAEKQLGAAGNAAGLKAKLLGFMRERLEVGGVGDFQDCKTPEDVADALIDEYSGDARAALALCERIRNLVEARVLSQARDVTPIAQPAKRGHRHQPRA